MKITPELVTTDPASMKALQQLARETFKATFDTNTPPDEMAAFLKEYYTTESMEAELTDPNTATYFFKNEGGGSSWLLEAFLEGRPNRTGLPRRHGITAHLPAG